MDKEAETVINSLLANKKLADDLVDFLNNENQRLREALQNIACINPSATNSSYVMRDVALTATKGE